MMTTYYCITGFQIIGAVEADCYVCAGKLADKMFPQTSTIAVALAVDDRLKRETCIMGTTLIAEEGLHGNPDLN